MAKCVVCGCTDHDCRGCIEKTGEPCWWFGPDLCSACAIGIKALSLWQPWASFIEQRLKLIETRLRYTYYRGPLLICSAMHFDKRWKDVSSKPGTEVCYTFQKGTGLALAVAQLVDCRPHSIDDENASMVRFDPDADRYSWVLEDIRPVTPFAVRGRQGIFNVNESILRKVG